MSSPRPSLSDPPLPSSGDDVFGGLVERLATPDLYRKNPFRQLGISVLTDSRGVSQRAEHLRIAQQLGTPASEWAFAPETSSAPALRAAAQSLVSPRDRFTYEFFWFWPARYPEAEADAALDCLAQGDTAQAGQIWSAAAGEGDIVAWHNLAIYSHLLALDWEQDPSAHTEEALAEVWQQALTYWLPILGAESLWERARGRVGRFDDAQLTIQDVDQLRHHLPATLAGINARLACNYLERGFMPECQLHIDRVKNILGPERGVSQLETAAAPAARRIETATAKAREDVSRDPANGLEATVQMFHTCSPDLGLLELLCGPSSTFYRESAHAVASAALDGLVIYQRHTGHDRRCLPLLLHVLDLPATPELRARIADAFAVMHANALSHTEMIASAQPDAPPPTAFEADLWLVLETLIPGLEQLPPCESARHGYQTWITQRLALLARDARRQDRISAATLHALEAALGRSSDPETQHTLATIANRLQANAQKALRLETSGRALIIDARGVSLDGVVVPIEAVTGIRYAVFAGAEPETPPRRLIAWCSAETAFELDESSFLGEPGGYELILDALNHFVAPELVDVLTASIRGGNPLSLGSARFGPEGLLLAKSALFWKSTVSEPYAKLRCTFADNLLSIANVDTNETLASVDTVGIWNAVIADRLVSALTLP